MLSLCKAKHCRQHYTRPSTLGLTSELEGSDEPAARPQTQPFQCSLSLSLLEGHLIALQGFKTLHEESHRYAGFGEPQAHDLDLPLVAVTLSFWKKSAELWCTNWGQDCLAVRSLLAMLELPRAISR